MDELKKNRDRLLDSLADVVPEVLDSLMPEERNQVYKMLRLRVVANLDGSLEISGTFGGCFVLQDASQEYAGGKQEWTNAGYPIESGG